MFHLTVRKNLVDVEMTEPMTSGSQNVYVMEYSFSPEWETLQRVAVFAYEDSAGRRVAYQLILDNTNQCMIPWEVMKAPYKKVYAGAYGVRDGNVVLPTVWADIGTMLLGVTTGLDLEPPTPSIYEQLLMELDKLQNEVFGDNANKSVLPVIHDVVIESFNQVVDLVPGTDAIFRDVRIATTSGEWMDYKMNVVHIDNLDVGRSATMGFYVMTTDGFEYAYTYDSTTEDRLFVDIVEVHDGKGEDGITPALVTLHDQDYEYITQKEDYILPLPKGAVDPEQPENSPGILTISCSNGYAFLATAILNPLDDEKVNWNAEVKASSVIVTTGPGVPFGGKPGQIVSKASTKDFDTEWVDPSAIGIPEGGAAGQFLKKSSNGDYDTKWSDPIVPAGGTAHQVLTKVDGTDLNVEWKDPPVAKGGSIGQVLSKKALTDYETEWTDPVPLKGIAGQFLQKADEHENYNTIWNDPVPRGGTEGQYLRKSSDDDLDINWDNGPDMANLYRYKGLVADIDSFPAEGMVVGDTYKVEDSDESYFWDGEKWTILGSSTFDSIPIREITQEEYNALTKEEKMADVIYLIVDAVEQEVSKIEFIGGTGIHIEREADQVSISTKITAGKNTTVDTTEDGSVVVNAIVPELPTIPDPPIVPNKNMLLNWDFRQPVNRNGLMEYNDTRVFTIDLWKTENQTKVTIGDGYITLCPTSDRNARCVFQEIDATRLVGVTVTVSLLYAGVYSPGLDCYIGLYKNDKSFVICSNHVQGTADVGLLSVTGTIPMDCSTLYVLIGFANDATVHEDFYFRPMAVKLELGTEQTLARKNTDGKWEIIEPIDYTLQYTLCSQYNPVNGTFVGVNYCNPNLLDNAIWDSPSNVISQTGTTSWTLTTIKQICFDRWKYVNLDKVEILADHITLTDSEASNNYPTISQNVDSPGNLRYRTVTISALIRNPSGLKFQICLKASRDGVGGSFLAFTQPEGRPNNNYELFHATGNCPGTLTDLSFNILVNYLTTAKTGSIEVKGVKVELGPVQTLAYYDNGWWLKDAPDYGTELAKCQRHQVRLKGGAVFAGMATGSSEIKFGIPLSVQMRANPASTTMRVQLVNDQNVAQVNNAIFTPTSWTMMGGQVRVRGNVAPSDDTTLIVLTKNTALTIGLEVDHMLDANL